MNTQRAFFSLLAVPGLLVAACSAPEPDDGMSVVTADLDARIPALREAAGVHGFTIAVAEHGELVWSTAYGQGGYEEASAD